MGGFTLNSGFLALEIRPLGALRVLFLQGDSGHFGWLPFGQTVF